jgi:uncharacterized protein (DUF433 family)
MSKFDFRNIEKVPGKCGGRAVIADTRIRVSLILELYREGMTVEEIVQHYPHVRPADVHDALAYAYEHYLEIEGDILDDREADGQRAKIDLRERGIDEQQAADLRRRLVSFAEDWERPEMEAYDAL